MTRLEDIKTRAAKRTPGRKYKPRKRRPVADRFWEKVDKSGECWLWTGGCGKSIGYGTFWDGERQACAHRWAYEDRNGPIPVGSHIDHLCRTPACVRPDHLEAVSPAENNRRSDSITARNAIKTHCVSGHPLSGDNLYRHPRGDRKCRTCGREQKRAERARAALSPEAPK